MILNTAIETMDQLEKLALQSKKLTQVVQRTYEKTQFYQQSIQALGLDPTGIQGIQDIHKLPFTTAVDLARNFPFGLLTMPISGVARFEQTADCRMANGFTSQDLIGQEELIARSVVACNIARTSVLLHLSEALPSISARVLQQSCEALGITVVTEETGDQQHQLNTILVFGVTTLFATPATLIAFAAFLEERGVTTKDLPLMNILCEAQHLSPNIQKELVAKFQVPVYTLYGRSDIMNLGIGGECYQQQGIHIHDDHFYPEVINPLTHETLGDHELGELVITTISREATPLLRYRTGEMVTITHETCTCGRTSARIILDR